VKGCCCRAAGKDRMHDGLAARGAALSWRQWLGSTPRGAHASSPWLRGFIVGGLICASLLLLGFHIPSLPPVLVWILVVGLFCTGCWFRRHAGFTSDASWTELPVGSPSYFTGPSRSGEYEALDVDEEAQVAQLASTPQTTSTSGAMSRVARRPSKGDVHDGSNPNLERQMFTPGRHHSLPPCLRTTNRPERYNDISPEEATASRGLSVDEAEKAGKTLDLPENIWSLNLVASVGQAHFAGGKHLLPVPVAFASTVVLGVMQVLTIFLIVHDVNQNADPVTVKPSTPWLHKAWTVNTMKWCMILFLLVGLSNDASQCGTVMKAAFKVRDSQLTVPRWTTLAIPAFQFLVLMGVVWGGVSVILSCQAVPDILYNSLAITFVVNADELFYDFFMRTMDLDPDLQILIYNRVPDPEAEEPEGEDSEDEDEERDRLLDKVQKIGLIIPICFGFSIAIYSCLTGTMPTKGLGLHEL